MIAPVPEAADRAVHGALAGDLGRLARRLGRLDVRRPRARRRRRPRRTAPAGRPTRSTIVRWLCFLALALTIGSLGFRLICLRRLPVPRALDRKIAVAAGLGAWSALEVGIAAFSLRAEDALQLPFGKFLYGDLSPMAQTRFGEAFVDDDARLRARRSRSSTSPGCSIASCFSCRRSCSRSSSSPGSRSRATTRSTPARRGRPSSPTGCTSRRRRSGSAGSRRWRCCSGSARRSSRRAAFVRFSQLATVLIALVLAAGTYLGDRAAAAPARPLDDRLRAGAAREALARLVAPALGRVPPLRRSARRSSVPTRGSCRASAAAWSARASSASPCCSSRRSSSTRSRRRVPFPRRPLRRHRCGDRNCRSSVAVARRRGHTPRHADVRSRRSLAAVVATPATLKVDVGEPTYGLAVGRRQRLGRRSRRR